MALDPPPVIAGDSYARWLEIVRFQDVRVLSHHPALLPGHLQTETTIRAMLATTSLPEAEIERTVVHRLARREEVLSRARLREHQVLIWEPALAFPGLEGDARYEQVGLLLEAISKGVRIRIVPQAAGYYHGLLGHFSLAVLPSNTVMFVENVGENQLIRGPLVVEAVRQKFEQSWNTLALTDDDTLDAIAGLLP